MKVYSKIKSVSEIIILQSDKKRARNSFHLLAKKKLNKVVVCKVINSSKNSKVTWTIRNQRWTLADHPKAKEPVLPM